MECDGHLSHIAMLLLNIDPDKTQNTISPYSLMHIDI